MGNIFISKIKQILVNFAILFTYKKFTVFEGICLANNWLTCLGGVEYLITFCAISNAFECVIHLVDSAFHKR